MTESSDMTTHASFKRMKNRLWNMNLILMQITVVTITQKPLTIPNTRGNILVISKISLFTKQVVGKEV
jgi:hypothetical protein